MMDNLLWQTTHTDIASSAADEALALQLQQQFDNEDADGQLARMLQGEFDGVTHATEDNVGVPNDQLAMAKDDALYAYEAQLDESEQLALELQQLEYDNDEILDSKQDPNMQKLAATWKDKAWRFVESILSAHDEINSQLAEVESRELANIEKALEQMREGTYGVCENCDKKK